MPLQLEAMASIDKLWIEEAKAAGVKLAPKGPAATPVCDKMKAAGQWNTAWDGFFEIDPAWTEAIIVASLPVYTSGVFTRKLAELLSIAVDASITAGWPIAFANTAARPAALSSANAINADRSPERS